VQFTRIAQLQAELDLLVGALRRLPDVVQRDLCSLDSRRARKHRDDPTRGWTDRAMAGKGAR
jgi:hypothetical protein